MGLSLIQKFKCPKCNDNSVEASRYKFAGSVFIKLSCNHSIIEKHLNQTDYSSIKSSDGRSPMNYQIDGVKFVEASNARCLIADEQGLGKTVQALISLRLHKDELLPAVVVTKTTIKLQWLYETIRWLGTKNVEIISSSKQFATPGMDVYIITYDILKESDKIFKYTDNIQIIILDEVQAIKDHLSGRAKAVLNFVTNFKIEHIIGLSGTPIKNNAGEYFTILNLLRPSRFPTYQGFKQRYLDYYNTLYGDKIGGLRNPELFYENTEDIVIRRTKDEVLKDLPELNRHFYHVELSGKVKKSYDAALKELDDLFYSDQDENSMTNMIAVMTKLRQITGISKVEPVVEFVTDFLLSTDRKIVVFLHHHVVRDLLIAELNKWLRDGSFKECLEINSEMSADKRAQSVKDFQDSSNRVLIASTLAAGEGLNLQFCSDSIMMERQWNPANEEQAESRFHRFGQKNSVNVTYMIVSETIDDYFTELVERKRAIVMGTLDKKVINWEHSSLMKELVETLVSKGIKRFTL